jgi:hypothetical protein
VVVLVLVVIAAAAYHGYRFVNRAAPIPPAISGAPPGTVGTMTPQGKVVVVPPGTKVDPKAMENFRNLERAKGNEVREISPGTFVVTPEHSRTGSGQGAGGAATQGAKP